MAGYAVRRELHGPGSTQASPVRAAGMADPPDVWCVPIPIFLLSSFYPTPHPHAAGEMLCM